MMQTMLGGLVGASVASLLVACASHTEGPVEPATGGQATCSRQMAAPAKDAFRIDPALSLATIKVYRGGTLARLGHDHVIASHDVFGQVDLQHANTVMCVPLDRLAVDEAALRKVAGFDTQPSPDAIAATRRNMLDKVLELERFPIVLIRGSLKGQDKSALSVSFTLHGVTREFDVPVQLETTPGGLTASGSFSLKQTDFGIVPLSILGGAVLVQDRLDVRYRIVARAD